MRPQLVEMVARSSSVIVSFGAGLALLAYGLYIRLGRSKQYYLRERKGILGPSLFHVFPLLGIVLCLLGLTGLCTDLETRQRLLIYLVTPAFLITVLIAVAQPSWVKPAWLSRLQSNHADIFRFLGDVAREEVGDDADKAREWSEAMDTLQGQNEWVARVRKRRGWPRRELQSARRPSIKVPRQFRRQIAQVQQLPPSSKGLEDQIEIYEEILSDLDREKEPAFWASVQNKLGIAYAARRRGNKGENQERAIGAYQAAVEVTERHGLKVDWAMAQNNLGAAYRKRVRGDKADNVEKAIAAYEAALGVLNRDEFPAHWAGTQTSLGLAYSHRVRGERRENLDQAIAAYRSALEAYTEEEFPKERTQVLRHLEETMQQRENA
jgi:tetratricopeptide (TPR) repeat protein